MGRVVRLVLVDGTGDKIGVLPTFTVEHPWWQDIGDVVQAARENFGVEVDVLRLLGGVGDGRPASGGEVTYLAQLSGTSSPTVQLPTELASSEDDLSPDPLRMPWAEPGGPRASVAWASDTLARHGFGEVDATQERSWNLSAIWRMSVAGDTVAWLKQVPPFFEHEPNVLRLVAEVAPGVVPAMIAAGTAGRMLLSHAPGVDGHGADAAVRSTVAELLHPVQARYAGEIDTLRAAGLPDRRLGAERFAEVAALWVDRVEGIRQLITALPALLQRIEACGLPDTLVHGDLHPGNVRIGEGALVIIDWGDASLSHPAYDILLLTEGLPDGEARAIQQEWAARWRATVAGSDPSGALELMRPLAALRGAVTMHDFVANIEPTERVYHADDERELIVDAVRTAP